MKRLNTRLDEHERQAGTGDSALSVPEKTLLVSILGRRDALFWPWRWNSKTQPPIPEIRQRQREYLAGVVGISAKADGRHDWKNASERRQSLIASGHLAATQSSGQVSSLFLTPAGEATGRALVGDRLFTVHRARAWRLMLQILTETHGPHIRESVLFGLACTGNPAAWEAHIEPMLSLMTAGIVSADSDTCGRALFTMVEGATIPETIAVDVAEEEQFDSVYVAAFNAERNVLENAEPRDPSEIYVPKSASLYWPESKGVPDEE